MRFRGIATDYDGTLAENGSVRREVVTALRRAKQSGRRLLLVTGRELEDLMRVFDELEVFDVVVAENGALLYYPGPHPREVPLAKPPPREFVAALEARGVMPVSCGRIIVATWQPHEQTVVDVIREQGLELEVIFNKGAVMVLPSGINKGTGLLRALDGLDLAPDAVIGIGDAQNDHSLLTTCGLGVAVANAVSALKDQADIVTRAARGNGVIELVDHLLANDLIDAPRAASRGPAAFGMHR